MNRRALILGFATLAVGSACGDDAPRSSAASGPTRCVLCGMRVEPSSRFRAGALDAEGAELRFDTPKCLLRTHFERGSLREAWVIEHYTQEPRPVESLHFILGSDVMGPMGRDLIPVAGEEAAARFVEDHAAERAIPFAELTEAIVAELFRPRA